ncbi:MAG: hypothetical protein II793_04985 [Bacteroidales bacterium]|nr:hypothetical protein [Bacteroidales bacterium]
MLVVASLMGICGVTTSCASSEDAPMYRTNQSSTKVINSRLKIKGTNKTNSATYRSY